LATQGEEAFVKLGFGCRHTQLFVGRETAILASRAEQRRASRRQARHP
jgi:hypothetical protein